MLFRDSPSLAGRPAAAAAPLAPLSSSSRPEATVYGWRPIWADKVVRARPWLVGLWALYHLVCFNGQWRVGIDTATYRAVGHSLANGDGYAILGVPHDQVYPGLPYLLAGLERLFGPGPAWPGILVMLAAGAMTIGLLYVLVRRVLPDWAAVIVTAGVAFNWRFAQQAHELMTDLPFLLGVVVALLGLDLARSRRTLGRGIVLAVVGTALAATMRPTIWVLVVTALSTLATSILVHALHKHGDRRRGFLAAAVGAALTATVVLFLVVDPRAAGDGSGEPANGHGAYERELAGRVGDWISGRIAPAEVGRGLWTIVNEDVPRLFFGERIEGLNVVFSLALLGGVGLVALRRDQPGLRRPLWALMVAILAGTCLVLSSEPRYWMMVLPVLWVGWVLGLMQGARDWFKTDVGRSRWLAAGLVVVGLGNGIHLVKFAIEQRATPFLRHYKQGEFEALRQFAAKLREQMPAGDAIIGPHAPILSYWSGRRVLGERELDFGAIDEPASRLVAVRDSGARWMVFPHGPYRDKDYKLGRLIRDNLVYPTNASDDEAIFLNVINEDGEPRYWWAASFGVDEAVVAGLSEATRAEAP